MKIMGLDLALLSGFSFGERGARPHYGTFKLPGFSEHQLPRSCASVYSAVRSMTQSNGIEGVVIEMAIAPKRKNKRGVLLPANSHGVRALTMISGAAHAGAINGGAKYIWTPAPNVWRLQVLGRGFPDKPKHAAYEYCRMVLGLKIDDDNACEAVLLGEYGHAQARLL
jgi:hypothetical protein